MPYISQHGIRAKVIVKEGHLIKETLMDRVPRKALNQSEGSTLKNQNLDQRGKSTSKQVLGSSNNRGQSLISTQG